MDDIVATESAQRGFAPDVVRHYLTRNIVFELNERDLQGLNLYLSRAAALDPTVHLEVEHVR
jgi:hypothetical protein